MGDCSFTSENGLEIQAANGRDLSFLNLSAPRLLQPVSSSFAVQTVCVPVMEDRPAIGGLLLWKDGANYLRLDRGARGPNEVSFQGCINNQDLIIGRGRLPAERTFLRLERLGARVNALCSADGENWFTVGQVEFLVEDPVEVGLHAIGMIDRTIYPGAFPDGTAIRFESFDLWGRRVCVSAPAATTLECGSLLSVWVRQLAAAGSATAFGASGNGEFRSSGAGTLWTHGSPSLWGGQQAALAKAEASFRTPKTPADLP